MNKPDEKNPLLTGVGMRVRKLRLDEHLTVLNFAKRSGLSPRFVNQLEAGEGNISIARLAGVAAALGRALPDLVAPISDDDSTRGRAWRWLSECSDEDLQAFSEWAEKRKGNHSESRFIALIGLRGAGKSTVGRLLAKELKTEFVEVDRCIEEAACMPLGEIFATHGEGYYRRLEREALARLFPNSHGCVLAPGGSVVSDAESWEMIKNRCLTVWLHATPEEFMRRMQRQGDTRPMQGRQYPMNDLKDLLARREPLYAESKLLIETTDKPPAGVVEQIVGSLAIASTV